MNIVCLDLEGVLVPEIWIAFAEKTGIEELKMTTRDEPNYDVLMKKRIDILKNNKLNLKDIQNVISTLSPLDGAVEFVAKVREMTQLVILSDTFEEFAQPLMQKLSWPTILCNSLEIDKNNMITKHIMRQQDGKRKAIEAFKSLNIKTIAAGDSYNDLNMIKTADAGSLYCPPASIIQENPKINVAKNHLELLDFIKANL